MEGYSSIQRREKTERALHRRLFANTPGADRDYPCGAAGSDLTAEFRQEIGREIAGLGVYDLDPFGAPEPGCALPLSKLKLGAVGLFLVEILDGVGIVLAGF